MNRLFELMQEKRGEDLRKNLEETFCEAFRDALGKYEIHGENEIFLTDITRNPSDNEQTKQDKISKFEAEILSLLEGFNKDETRQLLCKAVMKNVRYMYCPNEKDALWSPLLNRFGMREDSTVKQAFDEVIHEEISKQVGDYVWAVCYNCPKNRKEHPLKKIETWLNSGLVTTLGYEYNSDNRFYKKSLMADAIFAIRNERMKCNNKVCPEDFVLLDLLLKHDKEAFEYECPSDNDILTELIWNKPLRQSRIKSTGEYCGYYGGYYEGSEITEYSFPLVKWVATKMKELGNNDFSTPLKQLELLCQYTEFFHGYDVEPNDKCRFFGEVKTFLEDIAKEQPKHLCRQPQNGEEKAKANFKGLVPEQGDNT